MKAVPKSGNYYDLVTIPHGHIPVSKIGLWKNFPIPIKQIRDSKFYFCPRCGEPSFFKIQVECFCCEVRYDYSDRERAWKHYRKKQRKEYFRRLWKKLECLILPILILANRAWYVRSNRLHTTDINHLSLDGTIYKKKQLLTELDRTVT